MAERERGGRRSEMWATIYQGHTHTHTHTHLPSTVWLLLTGQADLNGLVLQLTQQTNHLTGPLNLFHETVASW